MSSETLLALDVGSKRIGVARADIRTKLAIPVGALLVDGLEIERLRQIIAEVEPTKIIIGYPRNQAGETTAQTTEVERFADRLREECAIFIAFQDESLTSVIAEDRLRKRAKPYQRADIDTEAATIILQDYIEAHYGY